MNRRNRGANAQSNIHQLFGRYCYAVEEFGMHLQDLARRGTLGMDDDSIGRASTLECSEFGFSPVVKHGEEMLQVSRVPNLFHWANREIAGTDSGVVKSIYVPHCTALRSVIAIMETGIRFRSLQWLDRMNWDAENFNPALDSGLFQMHIRNLTGRDSQTVLAPARLRDILRNEELFQLSFTDANHYAPANYNKRESTFDQARPLFRDVDSGLPIDDSECSETLIQLGVGFSEFCREQTIEQHASPAQKFNLFRAMFAAYIHGQTEPLDVAALMGHQGQKTTDFYLRLAMSQS